MKIGKFISEEQYRSNVYVANKFDYDVPVQIVGAVAALNARQGLYYLAIKHHQVEGSANFEWFDLNRFQHFIPKHMIDLETLKRAGGADNPYYWIHESEIRIFLTANNNQSALGSALLVKFEEDDE